MGLVRSQLSLLLRALALKRRRLLCFGGSHRLPGAHDDSYRQQRHYRPGRRQCRPVAPGELAKLIARAGRTAPDGFIVQMALDIHRQAIGRFVTARAILLQTRHHDPIQITAHQSGELRRLGPMTLGHRREVRIHHRAQARRGLGWVYLSDRAADFINARLHQFLRIERRLACEQFVEQYA